MGSLNLGGTTVVKYGGTGEETHEINATEKSTSQRGW